MRGEGLLYGLAFLGILGAGAVLVGPRLGRPGREPASREDRRPTEAGARPAARAGTPGSGTSGSGNPGSGTSGAGSPRTGAPLTEAAAPALRRVRVTLRGEGGALRGPLKPVVGARLLAPPSLAGGGADLLLEVSEGDAAFGAAGHLWVRRAAESLQEGEVLELPLAAPTLVVKVRELDGEPAEGVPVDVRPASPAGARRTDLGGAVVLDDLAPGLVVLSVGGGERAAAPVHLLAGVDREARVTLEPALRVLGRALDGEGRALPGARVEAFEARGPWGAPVEADPDGRFVWRGPVAPALALRVSAPGRASVARKVTPGAALPLAVDVGDVRLAEAEVEVSGRVEGARGRTGAVVRVEPQVAALLRELFGPDTVLDAPLVAPLDAEGRYRVRGLPGGVPLRLSLRGAGLPEDALASPRAGDVLTRDFAPLAGERLEGRVREGGDGPPAAGLTLLLSREAREGDLELPGDVRARTLPDGRFRVEGLAPGSWFVRAYRPGWRSLLRRLEVPAPGPVLLLLEPALTDPSRRVTGTVLDEAGRPVEGATVRAAGVAGRTGADGRFVLDGVESLAPLVTVTAGLEPGAQAPGLDPRLAVERARVETAPGAAPVTLFLAREQTLTARLVDGLLGTPLAWVQVVVQTRDGRVVLDRPVALDEGRLLLGGLPRAGLTLTFLAPGRRQVRAVAPEALARGAAAPAGPHDLGEVRLVRGLALTGRVTDAAGAPLAGVRLTAMDEGWLGGLMRNVARRRELLLRTTVSAADGGFTLEGLDPSRPAAVVAWAPGYAPTLRRAVFQRPEGGDLGAAALALSRLTATVDVRLRRGSRVSLLLTEAGGGGPVSGAIVDLESARNGSDFLDLVLRGVLAGQAASTEEWRAVSEQLLWEEREPGAYTIGPVEPGEYELIVEHPLYLPERRNIPVLDPSDPLSFEALEPEPGAVIDPSNPLGSARVRRGPEMVSVYGSDRMRLQLDLRPR